MISRILLTEVLQKAMSTGADFAEIYVENTKEKSGLHPPMPWIRMSGTQGG